MQHQKPYSGLIVLDFSFREIIYLEHTPPPRASAIFSKFRRDEFILLSLLLMFKAHLIVLQFDYCKLSLIG